ncbi:MAG: DUF4139 domain-containing protein [Planctomycetes bacterium]|nr:DUF4139 domain-containing protein [Planctomycetota bacterium]
MSRRIRLACWTMTLALALAGTATPAWARIKLITLPVRERVEIQLDNPNTTLVEEERIVPLVKGVNQVDFSWAGTAIDPETIVFRVIAPEQGKNLDAKVLSVSYPPNEQSLVWQVASSDSGGTRVRISYVLGNLSKSFNYRAVAARDEKSLSLWQYIRVQNLANEEFGSTGLWAGFGRRFLKPIGVNETKQLLMEKVEQVPVTKTYTCNPAEFDYLDRAQNKLRVPMHYVVKNAKANRLGTAAMPAGKVRIFQDDGKGTTAFLGEDWGRFTPIDDEMRLYLGVAQDIVVKRTTESNNRTRIAGNLYNQEIVLKYEIENFKDQPVTLDVAESVAYIRRELIGDTGREVQWELGPKTTLGDADKEKTTQDKVLFHVNLPARAKDGKAEKATYLLHVILHNEW